MQKLFSKVIVSSIVADEILNKNAPFEVKKNFKKLIKMDFVEIKTMKDGSSEHNAYLKIKKKYKFRGSGEAAVIALTCKNGGVIASNNLVDVRGFAEDYDLKLITTAFILAKAYEFGIKKKKRIR